MQRPTFLDIAIMSQNPDDRYGEKKARQRLRSTKKLQFDQFIPAKIAKTSVGAGG
jgi:hypothetical protein